MVQAPSLTGHYCQDHKTIEQTLRALAVNCVVYGLPNDTAVDDLLAIAYPDGVPGRCGFALAILDNGTVYGTVTSGALWMLLFLTSTSTIADYPAGTMFSFAGAVSDVPANYLICDGRAVSRAQYAALFAAIGTQYGVGDGVTTFNLPDSRRRHMVGANYAGLQNGVNVTYSTADLGDELGAETHTLTDQQAPTHTHSVNRGANANANNAEADRRIDPAGATYQTTVTGGGQPHNNLQPYVTATAIIKY